MVTAEFSFSSFWLSCTLRSQVNVRLWSVINLFKKYHLWSLLCVFRLIKMSNNDSLLLNISTGPKKKWTPPSLPKGKRNNDKVCSLRMLYSANVK